MEKFPQINNIEIQKKQFQEKLQKILNSQITTENINNFADKALDNLINLNDEIIESYPGNKNLKEKEIEDAAYDFYEMEGIENLLDRIQEKSEQIENINIFIKEKTKEDPKVFVPADKRNAFNKTTGDIPYEKKKIIPRLTTLLYLLETDFEISKEEITVTEGQVLNSQVRREPYFRVEIDELEKLVYICIEEGNVTYIFDNNKLEEYKIEIDDLDIKTKEERKKLLISKENLGTKVIQSKNWREKMTDLLLADELSYEENKKEKTPEPILDLKENLPQVSKDKSDEWYGFWTDENGRHWTGISRLAKKFTLHKQTLQKLFISLNIKTNKLRSLHNKGNTGYCYEDIMKKKEFNKLINIKEKVKLKNNEWIGFRTDNNGIHWGSIYMISKKSGVPRNIISKYCTKNQIINVYAYEIIINFPEVEEYINSLELSSENDLENNIWKDFYTDKNGKHWSTIEKIYKKLKLDRSTIKSVIDKQELSWEKGKRKNSKLQHIYCYEEILIDKHINDLINTKNKAAKKDDLENNKWENFWLDEDGNHWGSIRRILKRKKIRHNTDNIIQEIKENFSPEKIKIKSKINKIIDAYCYEDVIQSPIIKELLSSKKISKVNDLKNNQWKDFYTDEKENHWSTPTVIAKKLGISYALFKNFIDENKEILDKEKDILQHNYRESTSFNYEQIIKHPKIISLIKSPQVEKNEKDSWYGFWTDENDKHWGSVRAISRKAKKTYKTIIKHINKHNIKNKKIKNLTNSIGFHYCYEEIKELIGKQ